MGTITIEQYQCMGSVAQPDANIVLLDSAIVLHIDATTSTTPETLTLSATTKVISVDAVEAHRISVTGDTTNHYAVVKAGERRLFGVSPGGTLSYRSVA